MTRGSGALAALALSVLGHVAWSVPEASASAGDDVEVILVIDASDSMEPAIDAAKTAANEFVAAMPADVRIGVEIFGDDVTMLTPPTTDRPVITMLINSIVLDGDTALYDAVVAASQHFTPTIPNKVLVVLSDGRDEGSTATLGQAVAAVQGIHVEAVSLTTAETDMLSLLALGPVTSADDPAGVSAAFARVADLITEEVIPVTTAPTTVPPTTTTATATTAAPQIIIAGTSPATTTGAAGTTPDSPSSAKLWLGGAGVFAGLFGLGVMLFPRSRVSKARLGIDKPRNVSEIGMRTVSAVEEALERHGKRDSLATALSVADISMKPAEFVATVAFVALVASLGGLALSGPVLGVGVAIAVCLAVTFYVRHTKGKRQTAFADQLPDVLQLVTTALRSGYGLTQALESVAEEAEQPARSEFAHVLVEARMGRDLSDSMRALALRMGSKDLDWVVSAIDINRETGGNLSEILQTVGTTIRDRGKMAREVRTLTAEGRTSAGILTAFPVLMALWQWWANPENFALLLHGGGLVALVIAGVLMVLGTIWVHRIVNSVSL